MGLLGSRKQDSLRRDRVMGLVRAGMRERDEDDKDGMGDDWPRAREQYETVLSRCTPAERDAAFEALRRNGY